MMRALVTGAAGFIGGHLVRHLVSQGAEVYGLVRGRARDAPSIPAPPGVRWVAADLLDAAPLAAILSNLGPTHVFHLAGVLGGRPARETYEVNVLGTVNLLDAVSGLPDRPTVLISSSSAVYGQTSVDPIDESVPLSPRSPYAGSKTAQEMVALENHHGRGMAVVRVRTFNLLGPGQPLGLMASDVAHQIARAELDRGPRTIHVGGLSSVRDFVDVRDAVTAFSLLATRGEPGEAYNVCSGEARAVRECLETLVAMARVPLEIVVDQAKVRPNEVSSQRGTAAKLRALTGWVPGVSFQQSLQDLLDETRFRLRERQPH